MWLIMKEQDSLGISDGAIALTYLLWQLMCMLIKGCCMHSSGFMMMNQTAQPKASKCIWQSGFTTSMNHQTFGHASSKSRMIQDSVLQPNQIPLTVFHKPILRRWHRWPQSIIRIVLCLPPTLSQSHNPSLPPTFKIITYLAFLRKKFSRCELVSEASSLDATVTHWARDVYVAPSTGSRQRLRSSVQRTQRTAPACFESVKEGVTWEGVNGWVYPIGPMNTFLALIYVEWRWENRWWLCAFSQQALVLNECLLSPILPSQCNVADTRCVRWKTQTDELVLSSASFLPASCTC